MKITPHRDYLVTLESVAMTDIVLNMFIFFFISFSLLYTFNPQRAQKLEVKLPVASSATELKSESPASITLTSEGIIYLDKELLTRKELKSRMAALKKDNPDLSVVLRSDRLAQFKDVIGVLDILSELGITNLNIAALNQE